MSFAALMSRCQIVDPFSSSVTGSRLVFLTNCVFVDTITAEIWSGYAPCCCCCPCSSFVFRRKAASFRLFMCDVIVLAGSASSSGVHLLQHFILSARVPSGNCWKHLPHFCDVLYSSTKTMSQFLFFFTEIANFRVPVDASLSANLDSYLLRQLKLMQICY